MVEDEERKVARRSMRVNVLYLNFTLWRSVSVCYNEAMEREVDSQRMADANILARPGVRPDRDPARMLLDCWRYFDLSAEERDRELSLACRDAMRQWLAKPPEERRRWPPEPGPAGEAILARWMEDVNGRRGQNVER
jgi:hypothetical protein